MNPWEMNWEDQPTPAQSQGQQKPWEMDWGVESPSPQHPAAEPESGFWSNAANAAKSRALGTMQAAGHLIPEPVAQLASNIPVGNVTIGEMFSPETQNDVVRQIRQKNAQSGIASSILGDPLSAIGAALPASQSPGVGGAVFGGLSGLTTPLMSDENRAAEVAKQGALGAATGKLLSYAPTAAKYAGQKLTGVTEGAMDAFNKSGIPATLADIGGLLPRAVQTVLTEAPMAGSGIISKGVDATKQGAIDVLGELGNLNATQSNVGNSLKSGINSYVQRGKDIAQQLYDKADQAMSGATLDYGALSNKLDQFKQKLLDRGMTDEQVAEALNSKPMLEIKKILQSAKPEMEGIVASGEIPTQGVLPDSTVPYGAVKYARTKIGNMLNDERVLGKSATEYSGDAYGLLSEYLNDMAQGVGGNAPQLVGRANDFYHNFTRFVQDRLQKAGNQTSGTRAWDIVAGRLKDPEETRAFLSTLRGQDLQDARGAIFNQMGKKVASNQQTFDPYQFALSVSKLQPDAVEAIKHGMSSTERETFDSAIEALNKSYTSAAINAPASKWGNVLTKMVKVALGGAGALSLLSSPAGAATALLSGRGAAKLFTNQKFLNWLASTNNATSSTWPNYISRLVVLSQKDKEVGDAMRDAGKRALENPESVIIPQSPQGPQGNAGNDTLQPYYDKLSQVESGNNPYAKAKTSSASGLYQFTNPTWRNLVEKYGDQYGITMKDKNNPQAQRIMVKALTAENHAHLTDKIGRNPDAGELYMAHFLGPQRAATLIQRRSSNMPAANAFPQAAAANPSIFYHGGNPRSMSEVYRLLRSKMS